MRVRSILSMILVFVLPIAVEAQVQGEQSASAAVQTPQARIDATLRTAAQSGIPVSLLESKVAEGKAKNIPLERIAAAVEARFEVLVHASNAMEAGGIDADAGQLSVAADALQVGVDESLLLRVMRSSPEGQRAVATAVLTQLIQLGSEPEPAFVRVNNALSAGPDALANLQAELTSMLRIRGLMPSTLDLTGSVTGTMLIR